MCTEKTRAARVSRRGNGAAERPRMAPVLSERTEELALPRFHPLRGTRLELAACQLSAHLPPTRRRTVVARPRRGGRCDRSAARNQGVVEGPLPLSLRPPSGD